MCRRLDLIALALVLGLCLPAASNAAPVNTYDVLSDSGVNTMSTVQVVGATNCPLFGAGNCLVSSDPAGLAIDAVSVTIDLGTNEILDMNIFVEGPGIVALGDDNLGYDTIVFTDVMFQSTTTGLITGTSFFIQGTVTGTVDLLLGGSSVLPGGIPVGYSTAVGASTVAGTITITDGEAVIVIEAADLGSFPVLDEFGVPTGEVVGVKADFGFVAAVPEPSAGLLYGIALLIASSTVRRRAGARTARVTTEG